MKRLPKRAQILFLSILDTMQSEKEYGRGGNNLFNSDIDKELSKKDCFKRVTEEGAANELMRFGNIKEEELK